MEFVTELLQDAHFWVGVSLVIFIGILVKVGVPGLAATALDARGAKIQAQLDEANRIREEAQALLADISARRAASEVAAADMLKTARAEAKRLEAEAVERLADQITRRGEMAERKIASAEARAAADVKAAAADLAAQMAETVLASRLKGVKSDPRIDAAIKDMGAKLQ